MLATEPRGHCGAKGVMDFAEVAKEKLRIDDVATSFGGYAADGLFRREANPVTRVRQGTCLVGSLYPQQPPERVPPPADQDTKGALGADLLHGADSRAGSSR